MRFKLVLIIPLVGFLLAPAALGGEETPFTFSVTAPGGLLPTIPSDPDGPEGPMLPDGTTGFSLFTLSMEDHVPPIDEILSLELVLTGLTHSSPEDLDIYLFSPRGTATLEVMTDRGDGQGVANIEIVFSDLANGPPPLDSALVDGATYLTEGPGGMSNFYRTTPAGDQGHAGVPGGPGPWYLFIIDDSQDDQGALLEWTLRGTAVPEPMTVSLLALGALVCLRRRQP